MRYITKKSLLFTVTFAIFFQVFGNIAFSNGEYSTLDVENLAFKQELTIPIDTSLEEAKYQPIDIHVDFANPCWAKDETMHSVRVCYDDGSELNEIESQIYDLEHSDNTHINSCNLVFLIPEAANGKEKYYVFYNPSETNKPDYEDHIVLEDTHYFYEPIPGQKINFDYYQITEEGYVIYAVIQNGELLGNPISLAVVKFKSKSTVVETYNIDQLGVFDMRYGIHEEPGYVGSAWATKPKKKILVDGNLMVRLRIESVSPRGDIRTDNIYTYYYCPGETKSISVNVKHEMLETHEIEEPSILDGTYAGIVSIKSRSATIDKMNVGEILPSIILYGEDDTIREYSVPPDPSSEKKEQVLSTDADCDLGKKAWICLSDPSTGKTHGLIMNSNIGLVEVGEDGVQVKAYVKQNMKLPGLEADTGSLFLMKNTYEKGKGHDTVLPQGFNVNFDVEFITVEKEGYKRVDVESEIYQNLIKNMPTIRENVSEGEEEKAERFSLTAFVHLAPSFPLGSLLSAALGKNIPYIYAELYKEDSLKSSGSAGRLSLAAMDLDLEGKNLLQKIKTALGLFDWRNASVFKKIIFPDLEIGRYVVRIYRENPLFAKERQYIGFAVVELKEDDSIHIFCRSEGAIKLSIFDQDEKGVGNVRFLLESDDITMVDAISDKNGFAILKAPCYLSEPYTLKIIYRGFLVEEKQVTLGLKNCFIPLKESFSIEHYKLNLKIKDTWGFAPAVEVNPKLTSNEMIDPINISTEKTGDGEYLFTGLYPSKYTLTMSYKSFDVEKDISIDKDESVELEFPAEYKLDFDVMNSFGEPLGEGEISISRNRKQVTETIKKNRKTTFSVPPGEYEITVYSNEKEIAKQRINVKGDKKLDIVTLQDSFLHMIVTYLGVAFAVFSIIFLLWKRKIYAGVKLLAVALIIVALVSPWWVANGDNGITSTTTKTLLAPPNIVTLTSSSQVLGGEVSLVPPEVTMVLSLLSIFLVVTCLLTGISLLTKSRLKKTTTIISILSILVLIATISIFFYAMSMLTGIGVGSFVGSGDLEITLPGTAGSEILFCNWGPGVGFYLVIIAIVCSVVSMFHKKIETRFLKE